MARAVASAVTLDGTERRCCCWMSHLLDWMCGCGMSWLEELQQWLSRWKMPVLSVTHDVGEAFQLGAEVMQDRGGRGVQQGPVASVLAEERRG